MMEYIDAGLAILWPVFIVVMVWLIGGLVALFYARATRRPIFFCVALVAFLMIVERLLSPARVMLHYLQNKYISTGDAGVMDLVAGGYKFEWLVDALAAALLLIGIILEVRRARQRAVRTQMARAAGAAGMAAPVAEALPAGAYAQPSSVQSRSSHSFRAPDTDAISTERTPAQSFFAQDPRVDY